MLARAVVAQGIQYRVNKTAREATEMRAFMDTNQDPARCLNSLREQLDKVRAHTLEKMRNNQKSTVH